MQDTKLRFSEEELETMMNSRFFFVKQDVTQKILQLFGMLEKELMKKISGRSFFSSGVLEIKDQGKIFKGENYRFMPYLLLDCPRLFTTETVFAFRSMFLWAHEFSFTLHLQGHALKMVRKKLIQHVDSLKGKQFFFCVNDTPWEYSFEEKNYAVLDELLQLSRTELVSMLETKSFIKLSRKLEPAHYNRAIDFGLETFESLLEVLESGEINRE